MARRCCLHILNTQWRQVAGVPAPEWRLESCALPLGWGPRKLPKPRAFITNPLQYRKLEGWLRQPREPSRRIRKV
jgi:hypothetical protein